MLLAMVLVASVSCDRLWPATRRAECERKAGHTLKAIELVEQHLITKRTDKKALKLRDALRAELVSAELTSEPEGALVSVDGADPLGSTPITVPLDAGRHVFRFTLEGHQPLEKQQECTPGSHLKIAGALQPLAGSAPRASPVPPAASAPPRDEPAKPAPVASPAAARGEPATASAAPSPAPSEAVNAAPTAPAARGAEHSKAPLVIGTAGAFAALGGGVLILTGALSPAADTSAAYRQYAGYALVGLGVAAGIAALVWYLYERRPGH